MDVGFVFAMVPHFVAFSTSQCIHLVQANTKAATPWHFRRFRHLGVDQGGKTWIVRMMRTQGLDDMA